MSDRRGRDLLEKVGAKNDQTQKKASEGEKLLRENTNESRFLNERKNDWKIS